MENDYYSQTEIYINKFTLLGFMIHRMRLSSQASSLVKDYNGIENSGKIASMGYEHYYNYCSCLDALEDTEQAKIDFAKYGFNKKSDNFTLGEKYIRVYGVLNAVYIQAQAIRNLAKYIVQDGYNNINREINKLEIIDLRNKAAAHNVNSYGDYESYMLNRNMIKDYSLKLSCHDASVKIDYDVLDLMHQYNTAMAKILNDLLRELVEQVLPLDDKIYKFKPYTAMLTLYFLGESKKININGQIFVLEGDCER